MADTIDFARLSTLERDCFDRIGGAEGTRHILDAILRDLDGPTPVDRVREKWAARVKQAAAMVGGRPSRSSRPPFLRAGIGDAPSVVSQKW
jgi:hypothetical protein